MVAEVAIITYDGRFCPASRLICPRLATFTAVLSLSMSAIVSQFLSNY